MTRQERDARRRQRDAARPALEQAVEAAHQRWLATLARYSPDFIAMHVVRASFQQLKRTRVKALRDLRQAAVALAKAKERLRPIKKAKGKKPPKTKEIVSEVTKP